MDQLLDQIVVGLEAGSGYSLIGLAIVVIMKATDVPNFATATMGLLAAYMAWFLSTDPERGGVGWPFWLAIVIGLAFAAAFGAVTQFLVIRPLTGLSNQPLAVVASLGLGAYSVKFLRGEGLPSFLDWFPVTSEGFPLVVAVILAIITAVLTYLMLRHWVKSLAKVDHFPLLLLTIGLTYVLEASIELGWTANPKRFDAPWSGKTFEWGNTTIGWDEVITIAVGLTVASGLALFFRSTWGVRMRAIAEDGPTARMLGINAGAVSLIAWAIGIFVAGAGMILKTSSTVLEATGGERLILLGFIAAVLGGFTSLGGTFAGGLLVGLGEALAGGQISTSLQPTIALLVVVVVLLVAPGGFSRIARTREV
ncbi:branched-chain amino acid ABC transporter permease [Candidatus Poriferisocius sp.]|uniref:branched-chain amino acid ABC transporter permease n=1 Tax=Candidatus Poriferisocius sp. TaxID=3101276 RepID=UPI003B5B205C